MIIKDKYNIYIFIIGTIALIFFILIALLDLKTLLGIIPDDSFYYFQISSNFISGKGSSLDVKTPTNGYHPLWMIVLSPLFALKEFNEILPIRLTIILSGIISIFTAYILYIITREITGRKLLCFLSFCFFLFLPRIFLQNIYCEPSSLSNLLLATGLFLTLKLAKEERMSRKSVFILGIIS
ncbi:MAG: hypothetical protein ACUVWP_04155 [bacterium]